jgi:hypothetical protein
MKHIPNTKKVKKISRGPFRNIRTALAAHIIAPMLIYRGGVVALTG